MRETLTLHRGFQGEIFVVTEQNDPSRLSQTIEVKATFEYHIVLHPDNGKRDEQSYNQFARSEKPLLTGTIFLVALPGSSSDVSCNLCPLTKPDSSFIHFRSQSVAFLASALTETVMRRTGCGRFGEWIEYGKESSSSGGGGRGTVMELRECLSPSSSLMTMTGMRNTILGAPRAFFFRRRVIKEVRSGRWETRMFVSADIGR